MRTSSPQMVEPEDELASIQALEELYRRRYGRFLRVAMAILGSPEAAADAVQEAFARALRRRHSFRGDGTLDAWIWRTVLNEAHEIGRTRAKEQAAAPVEPPASENGDPADWRELRAAIGTLPTRQRDVLFLRHYADLSYDDIADVLGIARGTVAATLHAAHAGLRDRVPGVSA